MSVDAVVDQALTNMLGKIAPAAQQQQTKDLRIVNVPMVVGARGVPLAGGEFVFLRLGLNGPATVLSWSLAATVAGVTFPGSVTVDVLVGLSLGLAASICGGSPPRLAGQSELNDQVPLLWSTSIPDPSSLAMRVTAVDGILEQVGLTLRVSVDTDPLVNVLTDSTGNVVVDNSGVPVTLG